MTARRTLALLASLAAWLALPGSALAGTYSWSLPQEFTVTGANPDHGPYGDTPWTYLDGTSAAALARLDTFSGNVDGGLAGWSDRGDSGVLVGVNPQQAAITGGIQNEDTFPPGQMVLAPTSNHAVAIAWTSPLSGSATVVGSIVSDETASAAGSACASLGWDTWSLDIDGAPVPGASGTVPASSSTPQAISAGVHVSAGQTLQLIVAAGNGGAADPGCAPVGAALQIQLPGVAPTPSLDRPGSGAVIADGQPLFSGTASDGFGDASTVIVRIYRGQTTDAGALVQTLTASRAGSGFSVAPSPFLHDGDYTAQVEQDDAAGDQGLSAPVSFTIADPLPPVTLRLLGRRQAASPTPTFTGNAGTAPGDSDQVDVYIWRGSQASGYPARHLVAPRSARGRWRIRIQPPLPHGSYVAIAAQDGPAGLIGSQPLRFQVGQPRRTCRPASQKHRVGGSCSRHPKK